MYLFAALTKYHRLGGLKQRKLIFLQSWRLEVQDLSVGNIGFPVGTEGRMRALQTSLLGLEGLSPPCVFTLSSLCVCVCVQISSPYKDPSRIE